MSTYRTMTPEYLGQDATQADLDAFVWACERVQSVFETEEEATDFIWNNGNIRFEADICIYCGRPVGDNTIVPKTYDTEGWEELAEEHEDDCEWVCTRSFSIGDAA